MRGKRRLALSQPETCLGLLRTISANEATEIALALNVKLRIARSFQNLFSWEATVGQTTAPKCSRPLSAVGQRLRISPREGSRIDSVESQRVALVRVSSAAPQNRPELIGVAQQLFCESQGARAGVQVQPAGPARNGANAGAGEAA